jgi:hypothetical protein
MKPIAFAHLTVTNIGVNSGALSNTNPFRSYRNVLNPVEKKKAMMVNSQFHDIQIIRGNFDFEINSYTDSPWNENSSMIKSILEEFNTKSEISSSSFNSDFFRDLAKFFGMSNSEVIEAMRFRTLNQLKSVTLKYDSSFPPFGKHIDCPGMASIAFYVVSVDLEERQLDCFEVTNSFPISLEESTYMIRFVKCGEVWVELIQRL